MNLKEWRDFLRVVNDTIFDEYRNQKRYVPITPEAIAAGWLGSPPASEKAIRDAEARLGATLPPSLRDFYAVSNGWVVASNFVWEILPVERLAWVKDGDGRWYTEPIYLKEMARADGLPDDAEKDENGEYYGHFDQYGRTNRSLVVSGAADAGAWLLDPGETDGTGEWAAGHISSWNPGVEWEARDFAELWQKAYETLLWLRAGSPAER